MKTSKEDIRALKNKHRLELVMQQAGEGLEVDPNDKNILRSTSTPGMRVDLYRQTYEIKQPGRSEEGDVFTWLKNRYSWSFGMAVKFLQNRPADPKRHEPLKRSKEKGSDAVPIDVDETKPLDQWQEAALQITGESIRKYFSWSYWDLALYIDDIRIEPTHAPGITHCPRCEERLDWSAAAEKSLVQIPVLHGYQLKYVGEIPVIAYSIKRRLKMSDLGLQKGGEIEDAINELAEILDNLFIKEDDDVVCSACAWKEYNFQRAIALCRKSARIREHEADEKQKAIDREKWQIEQKEREREESQMKLECNF